MITYYDESVLTYVASIRSYFGLDSSYKPNEKFSEFINSKKPEKIFLLLVDGMGANLINKKLPEDSFLRKHMMFVTDTVFPPTTTAATTSIRNGKAPNENGWLGWMQYVKEVDDIIIPFYGSGYYNNVKYAGSLEDYIHVDTTEDELNRKGIKSRILFPNFVANGCDDFDEMCTRLIDYSNNDEYKYIYAYWDKYDTYMHRYGPSSKICDSYLEYINYQIERLCSNLSHDTMLVVVADHGQIDVEEEYNFYGSKFEKYLDKKLSIEPRAAAFYIKDGLEEEFEKEFKNEFEDKFILLSHKDVLETHLFGDHENHPRFEEFIGDYLAIAKDGMVFAYKEEDTPRMNGQHAGCLPDEVRIPVIVYQK